MTVERVDRWNAGLLCATALAGAGVVMRSPVVVAAAVVPVAYVVFGAVARLPPADALHVERSASDRSPEPGERVTVRLTVWNDGERTLTDVRVVDGVPERLAVVEGSPRAALALRPGGEATVEYDLVARRGEHEFTDPVARTRTLTATRRRTERIPATGASDLDCLVAVGEAPLRDETTRQVGDLATDSPGAGLEFYATREYRSDDPLNRVDWRRFARTGDLTTVQFREQHAARVVVVVDVRDSARVTPHPGHPDGAELCAYVAARTYESLRDAGHHVGLTALGVDASAVEATLPGDDDLPWVPAGRGPETTIRAEAVLDTAHGDGGRAALADDGARLAERLARRLDGDAQVVLSTPAVDDGLVPLVRRLAVAGHETTVVSPDPTGNGDGGSLAAVRRTVRLARARKTGATVVDWDPTDPLWTALATALRQFTRL